MTEDDNKSVSTSEAVTPPTGEQATDAQGQLAQAVDDLLDQLQHKFDNVSREMFGKRRSCPIYPQREHVSSGD